MTVTVIVGFVYVSDCSLPLLHFLIQLPFTVNIVLIRLKVKPHFESTLCLFQHVCLHPLPVAEVWFA